MPAPRDRRERVERVGRWRVRLVSYRLGDDYVCVADNVDPGANLCRVTAPRRDEAEDYALRRAEKMLSRTRTFDPG